MATIELENASEQIRVYPSTYKRLKKLADKRRTSIAQIISEELEDAWKYQDLQK